ncbi:MAG: prealbumin-like fold domain-containing protein [Firmicutes bacterium]|nr:prealbumin-like fold domain-containing protein [Bacillota bacterium]
MISKSGKYPVLLLAMVFLLALAFVEAKPVFAETENRPEAPAIAAAGEGALPPAEWRYDGRVKPDSPSGYHPYDFDGKKLTLYWEQVLDGKSPVKTYEIYRARANSGVDWSDTAAWGRWPILTVTNPASAEMNWKIYATCSDQRLLVDVEPGREYVYGIRAISGGKTSGISKIPYPFRVPGQSLLGLSDFALIPDLFTEGKYALEVFFSGSVSRSAAVDAANYKVFFDNNPVNLKGPEGGKAVFDPVRNSAALDTDLSTSEPSKPLKITAFNITGPGGEPMNTAPGGPRNFIGGELNNHVLKESFSSGQGEVVPANPTGGQTTEYLFHFKLKEAVPAGGKIVIKFPADYAIGEKINAPDTSSRPRDVNGDINGPYGGKVKISGVQVNPGSNTVFLTLNEKAAAGDHLAFILDGITNPLSPASSGQSYQFSITAPGSSGRAVILPAFVKPAGKGILTVSLRDGGDSGKPLISGTEAKVTVSGPGLPPGGLSKTGQTGTFTFDNIPDNAEYKVRVTSAPAGFKAPQEVLPAWLPKDGASSLEFILDRINSRNVKTLEVTVNNLPQDLSSRAVVFAAGASSYEESATPAEVKDKGSTRIYRLNVRAPGEYRVGVYPYTPPAIPGMPDSPPEILAPPAKIYNIVDNTAINIKLVPRSMLADVKFELKDTDGRIPVDGSVYAYSPASSDTGVTGGKVGSSGQATLKLKKGSLYIVGGSAPGMPAFPERKVYVDGGGDVYVDGSPESVSLVPLRFINPGMKITGYIRYSDGTPAAGLTVTGRRNNSAAGGYPPAAEIYGYCLSRCFGVQFHLIVGRVCIKDPAGGEIALFVHCNSHINTPGQTERGSVVGSHFARGYIPAAGCIRYNRPCCVAAAVYRKVKWDCIIRSNLLSQVQGSGRLYIVTVNMPEAVYITVNPVGPVWRV